MNESTVITIAIKNLAPDAEFTFTNDDPSTAKSLNGAKLPSTADIKKEMLKVRAQEIADQASQQSQKDAILAKLGLTQEEAKILFS